MSLPLHREPVRREWIDYNGHLSEPYYVLVFGHATDGLMDQVGLDADYRGRTGCSLYTVEAHVRYLREVALGAELCVRTRVLGVRSRTVHYCLEMTVDDSLVATEELLGVHVEGVGTGARSVPWPTDTAHELDQLIESSPPYAGRWVGQPASRGGEA